MKVFLYLSSFLLAGITFSQSKKEQIEQLNNRVDSLNKVLSSERIDNSKKISTLESSKTYLEERYNELENDYNSLVNKVSILSNDLQTSKTEIASKQHVISDLQAQLKTKKDSLEILKAELEKLKPAPKPVVVNNSTNQVTQNGSYKSVKIGTQTWMKENLNVSTFRNGDPIPEAKTNEEWEKAGKEGKPAWCYYDNDPKNGAKYGKLYNWYAVNDPRGLAPAGWHIPTDAEWTTLDDQLGDDAGKKMKSASGWNGYGCKKCDGGSSEFKKICSACKGTQSNSSEPNSGNGTNSSGFSGLPGGYRYYDGSFDYVGDGCDWWSASESITVNACLRNMNYYFGSLARNNRNKEVGLSVRCLRD